jgi:hypothetical protein
MNPCPAPHAHGGGGPNGLSIEAVSDKKAVTAAEWIEDNR